MSRRSELKIKIKKGGGAVPAREEKMRMTEELWLGYFNVVLFEKGIITERECTRMSILIENRRPAFSPKSSKG